MLKQEVIDKEEEIIDKDKQMEQMKMPSVNNEQQ